MELNTHQRQRVNSWRPTDGVLLCRALAKKSRRENTDGAEENFQQHEIQDPREATPGALARVPLPTGPPCAAQRDRKSLILANSDSDSGSRRGKWPTPPPAA